MSEVMTEDEVEVAKLVETTKHWVYYHAYDGSPDDLAEDISLTLRDLDIQAFETRFGDMVFVEFHKKETPKENNDE